MSLTTIKRNEYATKSIQTLALSSRKSAFIAVEFESSANRFHCSATAGTVLGSPTRFGCFTFFIKCIWHWRIPRDFHSNIHKIIRVFAKSKRVNSWAQIEACRDKSRLGRIALFAPCSHFFQHAKLIENYASFAGSCRRGVSRLFNNVCF